ncbi:hypothetical protein [Actinomadura rudentiformis]|uniref:Uncharacterized protein n=1 Tax=Actinomadura rudentiformis TaxID=359158 RepID=A0A6H9YS41_9ACTN|nr:hypothetical protein [Actinomadura rudentiformis]KAB2350806.1 hypothetical protein F8566_07480 [Actinomadura rudentiformis]
MNIVQRTIAVGATAVAAGAMVPAAHAAAPGTQAAARAQAAAGAQAANACDAKNLKVIPVSKTLPKTKDPKVGLKMRLYKERGEGGMDHWAEFVVTYCPNNVNPAHLKDPKKQLSKMVVLKFTITSGKKKESRTCDRGQYFWRHAAHQRNATKPKPMSFRCQIPLPNHKTKWKGAATLTYNVYNASTGKRKQHAFPIKTAVVK